MFVILLPNKLCYIITDTSIMILNNFFSHAYNNINMGK